MTTICSLIVLLSPALWGQTPGDQASSVLSGDISFSSNLDGSEQRYVLMPPSGFSPAETHDVLIALHGHGSDRWQFIKDPRDECRAVRDVAERHQMILVSPDYRASTSWMGPAAEADMVQIIQDLKQHYRVRRVIMCGGSMGGAACLTFACLHPDLVDGVASMNGTANLVEYDQFQDAIAESFGGSKTDKPEEYRKRSAEFFPERFTMPVALAVSGKDESVPPASALRFADSLKKLNRKVILIHRPDLGHITTYEDAVSILEFIVKE